ncbi:MAG: lactate racemase domain-containing protein, partial [Lentisphaerae bacterium]|nr:lactate racemase domain-containing protein [Lentisphaerota bacterium]
MATWYQKGGPDLEIGSEDLAQCLDAVIAALPSGARKILLIPPDFSRFHSGAGEICTLLYNRLHERAAVELLPALGTHRPMSTEEMNTMFPGVPHDRILVHDWRAGVTLLGEMPGQRLAELSGGKVDYKVRVEVDRIVAKGGYDAIISVGQIVPHEVIGMAGGNKNILVGAGGPDIINKSHFLGAVCNMETIMGHIESPVRTLFNEAEEKYLSHLPISYILTVRSKNAANKLVTRGLYAGNTRASYLAAARLSQQVNIIRVPPLPKVVVYL